MTLNNFTDQGKKNKVRRNNKINNITNSKYSAYLTEKKNQWKYAPNMQLKKKVTVSLKQCNQTSSNEAQM